MGFIQSGFSAIGKLLIVTALAGTFLVGMAGVFYLSLIGEEVEIPKIVGKNVNTGQDELEDLGLRLKKVAYRYSTEPPNTILEQRPRAGEAGKTGLMVSVILSKADPDGNEAPITVEDKEKEAKENEEGLKELPELETEKSKAKPKKENKKTTAKTRDVIKDSKKDDDKKDENKSKDNSSKEADNPGSDNKSDGDKKETKSESDKSNTPPAPKNNSKPTTEKPPKTDDKPKNSGDTRSRKVPPSN